jgi:hypothetical protein
VGFDGNVRGAWHVGSPWELLETVDGAVGFSQQGYFELRFGEQPTSRPMVDVREAWLFSRQHLVTGSNPTFSVYDLVARTVSVRDGPRRTAIYAAGSSVIAETPSSALVWS